jgi:hypothetical protein
MKRTKKFLALALGIVLTAPAAMADLTAADITAEMTAGKTAAGAALAGVAGIWGLFMLAKLLRRAAGKV